MGTSGVLRRFGPRGSVEGEQVTQHQQVSHPDAASFSHPAQAAATVHLLVGAFGDGQETFVLPGHVDDPARRQRCRRCGRAPVGPPADVPRPRRGAGAQSQDDELVAAPTRHDIRLAEHPRQGLGDGDNQPVACFVAELVIDAFEPVGVHERTTSVPSTVWRAPAPQPHDIQAAPVEQAGERIPNGGRFRRQQRVAQRPQESVRMVCRTMLTTVAASIASIHPAGSAPLNAAADPSHKDHSATNVTANHPGRSMTGPATTMRELDVDGLRQRPRCQHGTHSATVATSRYRQGSRRHGPGGDRRLVMMETMTSTIPTTPQIPAPTRPGADSAGWIRKNELSGRRTPTAAVSSGSASPDISSRRALSSSGSMVGASKGPEGWRNRGPGSGRIPAEKAGGVWLFDAGSGHRHSEDLLWWAGDSNPDPLHAMQVRYQLRHSPNAWSG